MDVNRMQKTGEHYPSLHILKRVRGFIRHALMFGLAVCSACWSESVLQAQQRSLTGVPDALARARALADEGKLHEAEDAARSYLGEHVDEANARYLLAYILFREGQPVPSLAEYTRAARAQPPKAQQLFYVALDYVLAKDYADADKWMTMVTERTPGDSEAWYSLGRIKYTENRFQESIHCFEKALALTPRLVKAENNLGLAYEGLNQVDEAITAYRTAIAWQAESASPSEQPLINLGTVLIDRNELSEALPLLQQAEKIAPTDPKIRAALGRLYRRQGELAAAQ